ncbi:uracil-DNA glycosylase family protein [Sneathiella litorea]|uniref:Uracil-DNA glycosylase family protein n=1 Tax=Sneathiella litorea TaxID=2606216 RepID=A0A6L8W5C3_9PROT|nr:uracil-DNA glycosylase family protein [Sneathiella litorea]MZR30311.1 uracil-DNA glycosylase family protein [Sneathiella litorea]
MTEMNDPLAPLLTEIRACRICEAYIPLGPRPVLIADADAPILIAGQAPGTKVHESGIPWDDPSGDRLRDWLGVDKDTFYNPKNFAIVPQGFCYPGKQKSGGDAPPRPECAKTWHPRLIPELKNIKLTLAVGQYAHKYYLSSRRKKNLTETVASFRDFTPDILPLPHPSWRVQGWMKKNKWFEMDIIPHLQQRVRELIG